MQALLLFLNLIIQTPLDAVNPPGSPLVQDFTDAHNPGHTGNQDVEVAGKAVLQGGHTEELLHELIRIHTALEVNGQLEAAQIRLVPHIGDFPDLSGFDQLCHLVHDDFRGSAVGNLGNLNEISLFHITPFGPQTEAAPAGGINLPGGRLVKKELGTGGKVRSRQGFQNVMVRIFHQGNGGIADLLQIKGADVAGHTHGNALVGGNQHIGKGGGQQTGFFHGGIVIVHHIHGIGIDVPEKLRANGIQLRLRITGGRVGHITGIDLTEIALGVHKRM